MYNCRVFYLEFCSFNSCFISRGHLAARGSTANFSDLFFLKWKNPSAALKGFCMEYSSCSAYAWACRLKVDTKWASVKEEDTSCSKQVEVSMHIW